MRTGKCICLSLNTAHIGCKKKKIYTKEWCTCVYHACVHIHNILIHSHVSLNAFLCLCKWVFTEKFEVNVWQTRQFSFFLPLANLASPPRLLPWAYFTLSGEFELFDTPVISFQIMISPLGLRFPVPWRAVLCAAPAAEPSAFPWGPTSGQENAPGHRWGQGFLSPSALRNI